MSDNYHFDVLHLYKLQHSRVMLDDNLVNNSKAMVRKNENEKFFRLGRHGVREFEI